MTFEITIDGQTVKQFGYLSIRWRVILLPRSNFRLFSGNGGELHTESDVKVWPENAFRNMARVALNDKFL